MDSALLQDLVEYKGSKDKGVMMAARSLITLYREVAPEMLKRKDRGKVASMDMAAGTATSLRYGVENSGGIEGLDLLARWKEEQKAARREALGLPAEGEEGAEEEEEEEDELEGWDVESNSDSDSDDGAGWINVESDGEDIVISDSEDEDDKKKKEKKPKKGKKADDSDEEMKDAEEMEPSKKEAQLNEMDAELENLTNLATTRILTPADFAKLEELRQAAGLAKILGKNRYVCSFLTLPPIYINLLTAFLATRTQSTLQFLPEA